LPGPWLARRTIARPGKRYGRPFARWAIAYRTASLGGGGQRRLGSVVRGKGGGGTMWRLGWATSPPAQPPRRISWLKNWVARSAKRWQPPIAGKGTKIGGGPSSIPKLKRAKVARPGQMVDIPGRRSADISFGTVFAFRGWNHSRGLASMPFRAKDPTPHIGGITLTGRTRTKHLTIPPLPFRRIIRN